jgi:hypothetical protein
MQRMPHTRQTIIRLVLGVGFLLVAATLGFFGGQVASATAAQIEALPHLDAAANNGGTFVCSLTPSVTAGATTGSPTVVQIAPGSTVLIEGRLSALNQPHYHDFIAYVREEYRGRSGDGSAIWHEDQRVTPALLIDIAGGSVQLANNDYRLDSPHQRWQDRDTLIANDTGLGGTRRYTGLIANRPVTVIGILINGPSGPALRTTFVFGGTRAEYIAAQVGATAYLPWLGLAAAIIGLSLLVHTLRRTGLRGRRRISTLTDTPVALIASPGTR